MCISISTVSRILKTPGIIPINATIHWIRWLGPKGLVLHPIDTTLSYCWDVLTPFKLLNDSKQFLEIWLFSAYMLLCLGLVNTTSEDRVQEVRKSIYGILSYKHLKFLKYCKKWPTCSNNLKLGQYVANIIRINLTIWVDWLSTVLVKFYRFIDFGFTVFLHSDWLHRLSTRFLDSEVCIKSCKITWI